MSVFKILCAAVVGLALLLSAVAGFVVPSVLAEEAQAASASPTSIRTALERQLGKRAKLKLVSGQDLEGKVVEVTDKVAIIQELTGMEFFGATVRLDQVAAVIVRTPTQ